MTLMEITDSIPPHSASSMSSIRHFYRADRCRFCHAQHFKREGSDSVAGGACACGSDDDDSSVAMDAFLRSKMVAVFNSEDENDDEEDEDGKEKYKEEQAPHEAETLLQSKEVVPPPVPSQVVNASDGSTASASASAASSSTDDDDSPRIRGGIPPPPTLPPLVFSVATPTTTAATATTPTIYNPFSSYTPTRRSSSTREIMAASLVPWVTSANSPHLRPRAEIGDEDHDYDDDCDDDDGEDSVFALEQWAHKIRVELRQAEMVQVALEAERAAESGVDSFKPMATTYGKDDSSLLHVHPNNNVNKPKLERRKTVSEGIKTSPLRSPSMILRKLPYYRATAPTSIGVMELRDVNEVFPDFSQFHNHLRTHFARSHVDERTLVFKESSSSSQQQKQQQRGRMPRDFFAQLGRNNMSMSWSDRGQHSRSPSDFFNHARLSSDLFHQKTPSDFFNSLSFDRWVGGSGGGSSQSLGVTAASSNDTADMAAVLDILADHHYSPDKPRRRLPIVVVPPGLEMPTLDQLHLSTSTPRQQKKLNHHPSTRRLRPAPPVRPLRKPPTMVRSAGAALESDRIRPAAHRSSKPRQLARALFDDEEPESDVDSCVAGAGEPLVLLQQPCGATRSRQGSLTPPPPPLPTPFTPAERNSSPSMRFDTAALPHLPLIQPPLPPPPSDFLTPARLRVIRNSTAYNNSSNDNNDLSNHSEDLQPENLLVTPNSIIDSIHNTTSTHYIEYSRNHVHEASSSSIFLPQHLGNASSSSFRKTSGSNGDGLFCPIASNKPRISANFKPRLSVSTDHSEQELSTFATGGGGVIGPVLHGAADDRASSSSPASPPEVADEHELLCSQAPAVSSAATVDDEVDYDEIRRTLTPTCENDNEADDEPPARHVNNTNAIYEGGGGPARRSVSVKIVGSTADPDDSISSAPSISILPPLKQQQENTPASLPADCACLTLSRPSSQDSACSTPVKKEATCSHPAIKPNLMRRSSSTNALSSMESTPRGVKWNLFSGAGDGKPFQKVNDNDGGRMNHSDSSSKTFRTAMSLFSRISPKKKSPYLPPKENDDFLHNYLYCGKVPESGVGGDATSTKHESSDVGGGVQVICEHLNTEFCFCSSLFSDSSVGTFLHNNRRSASSGPLLSLSGDNNNDRSYYRMDPETWFDLDQFEFLEHLSCQARQKSRPWNVNFKAPTLRKGESSRKLRADSLVEEEVEGVEALDEDHRAIDEKKSDENSNSRSPKHARHLSYFPSRQGPQFALSDSQFEVIYGVAPEELADSLTRDLEVYHNHNSSNNSSSNDGPVQVVLGIGKDNVKVDVTAFLAGTNKPEKKMKEEAFSAAEFDPLEATLTF